MLTAFFLRIFSPLRSLLCDKMSDELLMRIKIVAIIMNHPLPRTPISTLIRFAVTEYTEIFRQIKTIVIPEIIQETFAHKNSVQVSIVYLENLNPKTLILTSFDALQKIFEAHHVLACLNSSDIFMTDSQWIVELPIANRLAAFDEQFFLNYDIIILDSTEEREQISNIQNFSIFFLKKFTFKNVMSPSFKHLWQKSTL